MIVSALYVYPVKAARGVAVTSSEVEATGLAGDRRFMVVDEHGVFLTQRQHPELARLEATLTEGALVLRGDDGRSVRVDPSATGPEIPVEIWGEKARAHDCGGPAAGLLTNLTGRLARLVRMAAPRDVDPTHGAPGDVVSFADGYPILITTTATIELVASKATGPTDARRFRPNIVVSCDEPFAEDAWGEVEIGPVALSLVKPCTRCSVLDVDPDSGKRDGAVLAALSRLRREGNAVLLGQNAVPRRLGTLRVGDPIVVRRR